MKISKRLKAIAKHVNKNEILADIGSDHALLPCYLVKNNVISKAYACDINDKPLLQAKRNIEKNLLSDNITTILASGISLLPVDTKQIVIAGMGFETIKDILENDIDKLNSFNRIIVQSNTDVDMLRQWISDHHYNILEEDIVYDGFYYQIIVFNTTYADSLNEDDILLGVSKNHVLYNDMWAYKLKIYNNIISGLEDNNDKYTEISNIIKLIKRTIKGL